MTRGERAAIHIRRATRTDKRAVRAICGADDYIPDVFDGWVGDRRGGLWVATIGDRAVGVAKLTLLGDREAWLHALRVHPRYRRRGVARALIAHRLDRAKRLGARVARLDTSDDNTPVHRLMREFGFRRHASYSFWGAPPAAGPVPRRATERDVPALWRLARESDGLLTDAYARRSVSRDDLARAVRRGDCLAAGPLGRPRAFAIFRRDAYPRLRLRLLRGRGRGLRELLAMLPAEAERRRGERVALFAVRSQWPALRSAGFRRLWDETMLVFEKRL